MAPPTFVNVALCNDRKYEAGLHVTLTSLIRSFEGGNRVLRVLLFFEGFGKRDLEKVRASLELSGKPFDLVAVQCDTKLFRSFRSLHGNYLTYVRLVVPELMPHDRLVFLDSDVIVNLNIARLFDSDLQGKCLGVVANGQVRHANDHILLRSLGMADTDPYFNAAVLVIDAARWRERGYTRRCLDFLSGHKGAIYTFDQTALNYVLRDDYECLRDDYNISVYPTDKPMEITGREGIFHFCGSPKPWDMMGSVLHGNHEVFESLYRQTALYGDRVRPWFMPDRLWRTARLGRSYLKTIATYVRKARVRHRAGEK